MGCVHKSLATVEFWHPQTGQAMPFLPPDSGTGTLVKVAVSEYIMYFNALKQGHCLTHKRQRSR